MGHNDIWDTARKVCDNDWITALEIDSEHMSLKDKKITSISHPFWHLQVSPALSLLFLVWRKPWHKWSQDVSRPSSLSLLPRTWRDRQDFMKDQFEASFLSCFYSFHWNTKIQTLCLITGIKLQNTNTGTEHFDFFLCVTIIVISFWPCLAYLQCCRKKP